MTTRTAPDAAVRSRATRGTLRRGAGRAARPAVTRRAIRRPAAAAALTAALALAACHDPAPPRGRPPVAVRVVSARRIDAPVTLTASGVVEPFQTVAVTAQVTGALQRVAFEEGAAVTAGQLLFRIDPRPFQATVDQIGADLARDRAQAEAGRRDDVRYRELAARGYVSREQADQVHATALAQAATVAADSAALRAARLDLAYATIRAPISGRTGSILVRPGNVVSPSSGPLVVIDQLRPVRIRFPILQQDIGALRAAAARHPLRVAAVPGDTSAAPEIGTLSFLDNAVDSLTGTIAGKARFANRAERLWPGELVLLTVTVDTLRGVVAVPAQAVQLGQLGRYVYVVAPGDTARLRVVQTGETTGGWTVIEAGVAAGERVVVDGQADLSPGARVAIAGTGVVGPTGAATPSGVLPEGMTLVRPGASGSAAASAAARGGGAAPPTVAPPAAAPALPLPGASTTTSPLTVPAPTAAPLPAPVTAPTPGAAGSGTSGGSGAGSSGTGA
jgi:multidrug efflux system membrane fusion protein